MFFISFAHCKKRIRINSHALLSDDIQPSDMSFEDLVAMPAQTVAWQYVRN